jgi:hypothetical protein
MRAVAHNPKFAKKVDIPQHVGREFEQADQRAKRRGAVEKAFKTVRSKRP